MKPSRDTDSIRLTFLTASLYVFGFGNDHT